MPWSAKAAAVCPEGNDEVACGCSGRHTPMGRGRPTSAADATKHAGAASDLRVTDRGSEVLQAAEQRLAALDAGLAAGAPALATALEGLHEQPFGLAPE